MKTELSILGLNHAQITVPTGQEDAARQFYCGVMGMIEIPKPESLRKMGGFWMMAGNFPVHVRCEDGVNREATKAHLAYEVADVRGWRRKLEGLGLKVLDSIPIPGYDRFEFRDPFGNRVEIIAPAPVG